MAYSPTDLYAEVRKIIADRAEQGLLTSRGWVVSSVLLAHPLLRPSKKQPDDFSVCMRQLAVAHAVDHVLSQLRHQDEGRGDPDAHDPELDMPHLPGFKHLRRVYPVRREGVIWLVPIDQMGDDEMLAKAETYRKSAKALGEHADEFDRYRSIRGGGMAA